MLGWRRGARGRRRLLAGVAAVVGCVLLETVATLRFTLRHERDGVRCVQTRRVCEYEREREARSVQTRRARRSLRLRRALAVVIVGEAPDSPSTHQWG